MTSELETSKKSKIDKRSLRCPAIVIHRAPLVYIAVQWSFDHYKYLFRFLYDTNKNKNVSTL